MGERTSYEHGTFSWTDLAVPDPEAAKAWYSGLLGWENEDVPVEGGGVYTMARLDGRAVAAIAQGQEGQPPAWNSYVTVDDVDAAAARAGELGGVAMMPPFDVMEAGRMAVLQDPTGAVFSIWQARESIGAELVNAHGALCLNQLTTNDPSRAQEFYSALFGWRIEAVPDGETPYWGIYRGEQMNGGMMGVPEGAPMPSHWLVYFGIDDIDAAAEQIGSSGGTLMMPKTEVPGPGHIVVAQDPQGAVFALYAGRFDD